MYQYQYHSKRQQPTKQQQHNNPKTTTIINKTISYQHQSYSTNSQYQQTKRINNENPLITQILSNRNKKQTEKVVQKSTVRNMSNGNNNKSRFSETRLLVLTLRRVFNNKLNKILVLIKIKSMQRQKYEIYFGVLDRMEQKIVRLAFFDLKEYVNKYWLEECGRKSERVDYRVFLCRILDRMYAKGRISSGFEDICKYSNFVLQRKYKIEHKLNKIAQIYNKNTIKLIWRKLLIKNNTKYNIHDKITAMTNIITKLYHKFTQMAFKNISSTYEHLVYEKLLSSSVQMRKDFYDFQNNKRQYLSNQRQTLQNLKVAIDNFAYEKNVKMGQMKREKAIKMSQSQQKLKNVQKQYQNSILLVKSQQRLMYKLQMIKNNRQKLNIKSQNSIIKVHDLYNQIKYEDEYNSSEQQQIQPKSSKFFTKITLIKQKFIPYLSQFTKSYSSLQNQIQQFQIHKNIKLRALISLYQNIPIQSIKLSQAYISANNQNTILKQSIQSIIFYHLLKNKGDYNVKKCMEEMQGLFNNMFQYFVQKQKQKSVGNCSNEDVKQSFISNNGRNSTKSINIGMGLKKKSSLHSNNSQTHSQSNKSIK